MLPVKEIVSGNTGQRCNGDETAATFFANIRKILSEPEKYAPKSEADRIEAIKARIERYNKRPGELTGYDCKHCRNKGMIYCLKGDEQVAKVCQCMEIRNSMRRIERSGLGSVINTYTFERYEVKSPWQNRIKTKAIEFSKSDGYRKWFYIGGQVGAGKTHICTAIVNEFLKRGIGALYMMWLDESVNIKAVVCNDAEYQKAIVPLKTAPVLYIDDLFKTEKSKAPTSADIKLAYEILNYRYYNTELVTILSSEREMGEILDIDEGVGSRIYERTKEFCFSIAPDRNKNYRLR